MKKIAVLTSGGDSSGMNACIKYLFDECKKNKLNLVGVLHGYNGLMKGEFVELTKAKVDEYFNQGGSFIKTSRSELFKTDEGKALALEQLKKNKIDYLIVIGGNGSLCGAKSLSKFYLNIIFLPGTIDNDIYYTDNTIGFDTAVNNATNAVDIMMDSMKSNDRGFVVEVMGRKCPDIAIQVGKKTNADLVVADPVSFDEILKKLLLKKLGDAPLIVVRENLVDVNSLAEFLTNKLNKTFKSTILGYLQRGGNPTKQEKLLTQKLSKMAIKQIVLDKKTMAIGTKNGKTVAVDFTK